LISFAFLKKIFGLATWLLLCVLMLALYVSFWRQGLALLPELEHVLEQRASDMFKTQVRFTGARGAFVHFKPSIHVDRVRVNNPNSSRRFMQLNSVRFSINVFESLRRMTLIFDVIQVASGDVFLKSNTIVAPSTQAQFDLQPWLNLVLQQNTIRIHEFNVHYGALNFAVRDTQVGTDESGATLLQSQLVLKAKSLLGQGRLQAKLTRDLFATGFTGEGFIDFHVYKPPFHQPLADSRISELHFISHLNTFKGWFTLKDSRVDQLSVQADFERERPLATRLIAKGQQLNTTDELSAWVISGFLEHGFVKSPFQAQTGLNRQLSMPYITGDQLQSALALAAPKIKLEHIKGSIQDLYLSDVGVVAKFDEFAVKAAQFEIAPLDGWLWSDDQHGRFQHHGVVLNLDIPQLFNGPLKQIQLAPALINWQLSEDNLLFEAGAPWDLQHQHAYAAVDWQFNVPRGQAEALGTLPLLTVQGEVVSSTPNHYPQYLPTLLSNGLIDWLSPAISQGQLTSGKFLFHGPLKRKQPGVLDRFAGPDWYHWLDNSPEKQSALRSLELQPSLQLQLKGQDLDFTFLKNWPKIERAKAKVFVGASKVLFDVDSAATLDLDIQGQGQVWVEPDFTSSKRQVRLQSKIHGAGSLQQGLQYLAQSPVAQKLGNGLDVIAPQGGNIDTEVSLDLHIDGDADPKIKVTTSLQNAGLNIIPAQLSIDHINGDVIFDLQEGLSGQSIQAQTLGGAYDINIEHSNNRSNVSFNGSVEAFSLATWLDWPILNRVVGETKVQGLFTLPWDGAPPRLELDSDLRGLIIGLPGIFGKEARKARAWHLDAVFDTSTQFLVEDQDRYLAQLALDQGGITGMDLVIGPNLNNNLNDDAQFDLALPVAPGQRWQVNLAEVDLAQWQQVLSKVAKQQAKDQGSSSSPKSASNSAVLALLPGTLQLSVEHLQYKSLDFANLRLSLFEEPGGWRLQWDGRQNAGKGFIPKALFAINNTRPLRLDFDTLAIPGIDFTAADLASATKPKTSKPVALDSSRWPGLELEVKNLYYNKRLAGNLELSGEPSVGGYHWHSLYGQIGGVHVRGSGHYSESFGTELDLTVQASHLKGVYQLLNVELPPFETNGVSGNLSLMWPGLQPSFKNVVGNGYFNFKAGVIRGVSGVSPLKWLNLMSAQSITRHLKLDFTDLADKGLSFDNLSFDWQLADLRLANTGLILDSPSLQLRSKGWVDLNKKTLFQECIAVIPILDHLWLPAAAAGGLPAVATAYVLDKAIGKQLDSLTQLKWQVQGPLSNPKVSTTGSP